MVFFFWDLFEKKYMNWVCSVLLKCECNFCDVLYNNNIDLLIWFFINLKDIIIYFCYVSNVIDFDFNCEKKWMNKMLFYKI